MRQMIIMLGFLLCGISSWSQDQKESLMQGRMYEEQLEYRSAYRIYKKCLEKDSLSVDVLNSIARVSLNLGRIADAESYFRKTLLEDSTNFYANYQLARIFSQKGDYMESVHQYRKIQQMDTTRVNPFVYSNMAECFLKMDSLISATGCYLNAFLINKENANIANALVNCLLRLGDLNIQTAIQVCDTALYYNPDNRLVMRNKAVAYFMSKEYEKADSIYAGLIEKGDSSFLTIKYAGASRYYAGRQLHSIPLLEKAYEMDTTDIETSLLLGSSLGMTYDRGRAFRLFDHAERLMQPDSVWINLLLVSRGQTLSRDGRREEAVRLFYREWEKNRNRLGYLYSIDKMYPNIGKVYKSPKQLAEAFYIKYLYLTEWIKKGKSLKKFEGYATFLQYVYEDAFFNGKKEAVMITPYGRKKTLPVEKILNLINRIKVDSSSDL